MGILTTLCSRRTLSFQILKTHRRPITSQPKPPTDPSQSPQARPTKKPLHALFTEAVGLSEKTTFSDEEASSESATELKSNLRQLEQEIKTTLEESAKGAPKKPEKMSLFTAFTNQHPPTQNKLKPKDPLLGKNLSPDTMMLAQHLYEKGYFKDANFAKGKENFDPDWFTNVFASGYIKFATHCFARDNQQIAKWLSGSALKQVAMFGCPSTHKSGVFPAKRLRKFFEIPENTVCSSCSLQQSCKFANQSVWNCNTNNLELVTVMKVITSYALGIVQSQLIVPDEVEQSVNQLLKEVVKLSQTTA